MSVESDHADAILGLLRDDSTFATYPAAGGSTQMVPDGTAPPYRVCWVHMRRQSGDNMAATSARMVCEAIVHNVGADDIAARAVAANTAALLIDVVATIAGRRCWPIRQVDSSPPGADNSTGVQVVTQIDVYRLESLPGT